MVIAIALTTLDAMKALANERPLNPIEFFSYYILTKNNNENTTEKE
jgi:hypothetical protein